MEEEIASFFKTGDLFFRLNGSDLKCLGRYTLAHKVESGFSSAKLTFFTPAYLLYIHTVMGMVESCIRPQPRYPPLAPPVKRRPVNKAEIMRPLTKRIEAIAARAQTLDAVSPTAPEAPPLVKATDSTVAWVKLEGKFSMDEQGSPLPLSRKLADQFRKQDHESKTLEKMLLQETVNRGVDDLLEMSSDHNGTNDLQRNTVIPGVEPNDYEFPANGNVQTETKLNPEGNFKDEEDQNTSASVLFHSQESLFKESLSVVENDGPIRDDLKKLPSVVEAIAKFDALEQKTSPYEQDVMPNEASGFVNESPDKKKNASNVSIEHKTVRVSSDTNISPRGVSEIIPS